MGAFHLTALAIMANNSARHRLKSHHYSSDVNDFNDDFNKDDVKAFYNYVDLDVQVVCTSYYTLSKENGFTDEDIEHFSEYCEEKMGSWYPEGKWSVDMKTLTIKSVVPFNYTLEVAAMSNHKIMLSSSSEIKFINYIQKEVIDPIESGLSWLMTEKLHSYRSHIRHDYRKDSVLKIVTDNGTDYLYFNHRGKHIQDEPTRY